MRKRKLDAIATIGRYVGRVTWRSAAPVDYAYGVGDVHGAGDLLVFDTWFACPDANDDYDCGYGDDPLHDPILKDQQLWRIGGGKSVSLRKGAGAFEVMDVDAGRIAVLEPKGAVDVLRADGTLIHRLVLPPRAALSAQLSGTQLVVLTNAALQVYDVATGAATGTVPVTRSATQTLAGLDHGIAVYLEGRTVRVVRLADKHRTAIVLPGGPTRSTPSSIRRGCSPATRSRAARGPGRSRSFRGPNWTASWDSLRAMAEVETTRDGGVLTITLNRPDVLNALNKAVHDGLHEAYREARAPDVRAVVITGAGRGFCVGQDLTEFREGGGDIGTRLRAMYHPTILGIRRLEKPVIAAVNGPAAGAGLSLACACDLRIAAESASFVPAFIGIGLIPDSGGSWTVTRLLGPARAFEWLTSNRKLTPGEAHAWGLVSEVSEDARLAARVAEVAARYASAPTRGVAMTKRLIEAAATTTLEEQLELEAQLQTAATQTADFDEGVAAFLEKRPPNFTGA
jgi:2-(1,2-epoxy-1,2-dihydrophenyl)acetyl-CoA isomerase